MQARDLIKTAKELAGSGDGKPRQSNLRRATSTAYYALFHALARCCADSLVGGPSAQRSKPAWRQVYRALEHGFSKNACQHGAISRFPQEIQDFANMYVQMQDKRHTADYDPDAKSFKSAVMNDIAAAEVAIDDFTSTSLKDRRAFAAFVLFKHRR